MKKSWGSATVKDSSPQNMEPQIGQQIFTVLKREERRKEKKNYWEMLANKRHYIHYPNAKTCDMYII